MPRIYIKAEHASLFTLSDAMIFVAATAIGFSFSRGEIHHVVESSSILRPLPPGWSFMLVSNRIATLVPLLFPWSIALTFAVLAVSLLRPRPGRKRLARQPGFIACFTVAAILIIQFGLGLLVAIARYPPPPQVDARDYLLSGFQPRWTEPGMAVMGAWLVLAINHAWRPEPGWIDRLGRGMGIFWIAVVPIFRVFF